ncbi:hypothetical protein TRAPUB_7230 [Trametes pubescens]|uniref:Uncharacterized protein n=1 Tax=Trametes pubescens TaxID=154538 RepID=A0A1M2V3Q5_TRAPU|nr:hypothetical protein TRAPUB_7230 [Trametes pubescens]
MHARRPDPRSRPVSSCLCRVAGQAAQGSVSRAGRLLADHCSGARAPFSLQSTSHTVAAAEKGATPEAGTAGSMCPEARHRFREIIAGAGAVARRLRGRGRTRGATMKGRVGHLLQASAVRVSPCAPAWTSGAGPPLGSGPSRAKGKR